MSFNETREFYRGGDYPVAHLMESAMSYARVALHHRDQSEDAWRRRGHELFALCDLFHNVAVWLVDPRTLPHGAASALDAVLAGAHHSSTKEWMCEQLTRRNRQDIVDRMELLHATKH
jgi:hypothetical protein